MSAIRLGKKYTTHKSGVTGVIIRIHPNETGTVRLCLLTKGLKTRWTTHIPARYGQAKLPK